MLNVATAKSRNKNAGDDHRSRAGHDAALAVRAQPSSSAVPHASNILEMNQMQGKSSRSLSGISSSEDRQNSKLMLLNLPSPQPSTATMQLGMMKKPSRNTEESEWLFAGLDDYEQALLRGAWKAAYDAQQQREQSEADHEGGASDVWSNHSSIFSKSQSEDEDGLQLAASVAHEDATSPIASGKSNASGRRSSKSRIVASDKDHESSQAGDCARRAKKQSPSKRNLREEQPVSLSELLWILILSVRKFTIYPHWRTFQAWELLVVSLVVFNGIMLPFELAFWTETGSPEAVQRVNRVADAIFWADLLQNFFVAHIDTWGTLHTDKRVIARAYVSSWFLIDLVACIPFELFVPGYLVSASDLLKCVRLLRLAKILRFLDRLQFAAATRIVRLFFTVLLLCHWVACLWYRLGMIWLERGECDLAQIGDITHGRATPLHRMRHCSWVIEQAENRLDTSLISPYLRSLYWSIATIMTVGYGDIVPMNVVEHILYIFVTVIGAGVYAHVFSTIVRVLERANALSNQYASVMEDTQAQMTYLRFPASLRNKIFAYYGNVFDKQKYMLSGKGPFYKNLPRPLALACTEALFFEKLEKIDFLHDCTSAFLLELCSSLNRVICIPGQAIIRQGEASDAWFIIESGRCRVEQHGPSFHNALEEAKVEDRNVPTPPRNVPESRESDQNTSSDVKEDGNVQELRVLGQGDHFGEIGLLTGRFRTATVRAIEFCELNYITVLRFYTLLGRFQVDNKQILHNCVSMLRQPKTAGKPNNMDSAVFLRPRPSLSRQQASKDEIDSDESAQAERGA